MEGGGGTAKSVFDEVLNTEALLSRYIDHKAMMISEKIMSGIEYATVLEKLSKTPASKARYVKIHQTFASLYSSAASNAFETLSKSAKELADMTIQGLGGSLERGLPIAYSVLAPSPNQVYAAAMAGPMTSQGWIVKDSIMQWGEGAASVISKTISDGFVIGQTADEVKARILGHENLSFKDGLVAGQKKSLSRIVRTALQHLEGKARTALYKENADLIKGTQWVSTLDDRTCMECAALDGKVYDIGAGLEPPIHWNCRCTTVPVIKSWDELGAKFDPGEWSDAQRASMDGQVAGSMTYVEWLKGKEAETPGFAKGPLGAAKYAMWKAGTWEPGTFDPKDGVYTVEQIKKLLGYKDVAAEKAAAEQMAKEVAAVVAAEQAKLAEENDKKLQAYLAEQKAIAEADASEKLTGDHGVNGAKTFGETLTLTDKTVGGSTGARMYVDKDGEAWFVKMYSGKVTQAQNEFIAANIYKRLGIRVPDLRMVEIDGQLGIASKNVGNGYVELGKAPLSSAQISSFIKQGFVADAYLANWDVAGLSMDNIMVKLSGNKKLADAVRIDTGGALLYRAQGSPKGSAFGTAIKEFDTLRDPSINATTAKLFSKLTKPEIIKQCKDLLAVPHSVIRDVIVRSGIDQTAAQELDRILAGRRQSVLDYQHRLESELKAERKSAKAYASMPGAVDGTWNGLPVRYGTTGRVFSASEGQAALEEVGRVYDSLPLGQQSVISNYTGAGSYDANREAREGIPTVALDEAIDKLPKVNCTLYRGIGDGGSINNNFDKIKSGEWAGLHFSAYSSTSFEPTGFYAGSRIRFIIENHGMQSGGLIEGRSRHNGEKEYIMGRNAVYHIIGWADAGNERKAIYLEEVAPDSIPKSQGPIKQWDYQELMAEVAKRNMIRSQRGW